MSDQKLTIGNTPAAAALTGSELTWVWQGGELKQTLFSNASLFGSLLPDRAAIPTVNITVAQFNTNDGATWIHGTSVGPMAIQDAGGQWWQIDISRGAWLEWFGCALNGVTDDSTALQTALNSGAKVLFAMSGRVCYCATGITIPAGVTLHGFGFIAGTAVTTGFELLFAAGAGTCVTLAGNGGSTGCGLRGVVVRRVGTPPSGSIGVKLSDGYNSILEDVASYNHAIPYYFDGNNQGICCHPQRIYSGGATDAHVVINNFPEIRFNQCRFGTNGVFDVVCNAFVRFTGNLWNTITMASCQFSQGHTLGHSVVGTILDYVSCTSQNQIVQISDCYSENTTNYITTDAATTYIHKLSLSNTMCGGSSDPIEFFNINAATIINTLQLSSCIVNYPFTFTPALNFYELLASGTWFRAAVAVTGGGTGTSRCAVSGCGFSNNLTISGAFTSATFGGEISGTITNTATTPIELSFSGNDGWTSFTPTLSFGNASVGITYSVQWGRYRVTSGNVVIQAQINLSSKGSSTGTARLEGLPFIANAARGTAGMGSVVAFYDNMSSLTGWPVVSTNGGETNATLYQNGAAATTPLNDGEFTNTSILQLEFMYAPS